MKNVEVLEQFLSSYAFKEAVFFSTRLMWSGTKVYLNIFPSGVCHVTTDVYSGKDKERVFEQHGGIQITVPPLDDTDYQFYTNHSDPELRLSEEQWMNEQFDLDRDKIEQKMLSSLPKEQ